MTMAHDTTGPAAPRFELALCTVRPSEADSFSARQAAMHRALRALSGFEQDERLRGLDDPTLFADYLRWAARRAPRQDGLP